MHCEKFIQNKKLSINIGRDPCNKGEISSLGAILKKNESFNVWYDVSLQKQEDQGL